MAGRKLAAWRGVLRRHGALTAVGAVSLAVLVLVVLSLLPPFTALDISRESLAQLALKAATVAHTSSGRVYSLGGESVFDQNDWLQPSALGLTQIERKPGPQNLFDGSLWQHKLLRSRQALPTSTWWTSLVLPPGTGDTHLVYQHPYVISVNTKAANSRSILEQAGLTVYAPLTEFVIKDNVVNSVAYTIQGARSGITVGASLPDAGDYVVNHYVDSFGPLHVVKKWELSLYQRSSNALRQETSGISPSMQRITAVMKANIARGSPFVDLELPANTFLALTTTIANTMTGAKLGIASISNLGGTFYDRIYSCQALSSVTMTTDAVELELTDKTRWAVIFDRKIDLRCSSINDVTAHDRLQSDRYLESPLFVRLAILDMSQHESYGSLPAVADGYIRLPSGAARTESMLRWRLMAHIRKHHNGVVSNFVTAVNALPALDSVDRRKALADSLLRAPLPAKLSNFKTVSVNVTRVGYDLDNLARTLLGADDDDDAPPRVLVFEDGFVSADTLMETAGYLQHTMLEFVNRGGNIILVGGLTSGVAKTFLNSAFWLNVGSAGYWQAASDPPIVRIDRDMQSIGPLTNSTGLDEDLLPGGMPASITQLPNGTTVELADVSPSESGWPLVLYCRRSSQQSVGAQAELCDGAVHVMWPWGQGLIQWIGTSWSGEGNSTTGSLDQVLRRAVVALACTPVDAACDPAVVKRILLVTAQEELDHDDAVSTLADKVIAADDNGQDVIVLDSVVDLLKGQRKTYVGNLPGATSSATEEDPAVAVTIDADRETLRDFVLRHALIRPVDATLRMNDEGQKDGHALLKYQYVVAGLNQIQQHTLMPPVVDEGEKYLYRVDRLMMYLTPLHRKLEYSLSVGQFVEQTEVSLEDDVTACFPSIIGSLCARSFGPAPRCFIAPSASAEVDSSAAGLPHCMIPVGTDRLVSAQWDPELALDALLKGERTNVSHLHYGTPAALLINFPLTSNFDLPIRNALGKSESLKAAVVAGPWLKRIRWAVQEDTSGTFKLDGRVWLRSDALDDLHQWTRALYRYSEVAVIADAVGLFNERRGAVTQIKSMLSTLFRGGYDHLGLLYDTTWKGIVPCGCRRSAGDDYCVSAPRAGLGTIVQSDGEADVYNWWLATACPALTNPTEENGLGFFEGHNIVWGYIVYAAAVAGKFDPTFLNQRVKVRNLSGVAAPRIHHLVLALIRDYANPAGFLYPYDALPSLHKDFPAARYKDWYRLHSYSSGVTWPAQFGPSQYSASEASFAYHAIAVYASVTGDSALEHWGNILTATEMYAANAIWHAKEFTETVPRQLRYQGAIGQVSELSLSFQSKYNATAISVFANQVSPLSLISIEALEPGWVLWMLQRWGPLCRLDQAKCEEEGGALAYTAVSSFGLDWTALEGSSSTSTTSIYIGSQDNKVIVETFDKAIGSSCIQMGSYDCGLFTLSSVIWFAALAHASRGAYGVIARDDGNGRFQIY